LATFGQYRVYLLDWDGDTVTQLFPGDDFLSIAWEHKRNQPGAYRCELVGETATKDRFLKHYQVLIQRNWGNAPGDWYEEYAGFHLGADEWWVNSDEIDEHYYASIGLSPEWLIDQPMLQAVRRQQGWQITIPAGGTVVWKDADGNITDPPEGIIRDGNKFIWPSRVLYDKWSLYGAADDIVKTMVSESMGGGTEEVRQYTNLAVEGDESEGNYIEGEGNWIRLLDAVVDTIGEDGSRGGCDFRVERVSGGYEFKTYAPYYGTDRRRGNPDGNKPTVFSFENGNMRNPSYRVLWAEEVTAAYGGWQGGGMERDIVAAYNTGAFNETPYNKREAFYDVRDLTTLDGGVTSFLEQKLIDDGLQTFVTAEILQTDACLYGRDWGFGDLVTLDLPGGRSFDMRIVEVQGAIDGENEERIEGVIELWTRAAVT